MKIIKVYDIYIAENRVNKYTSIFGQQFIAYTSLIENSELLICLIS